MTEEEAKANAQMEDMLNDADIMLGNIKEKTEEVVNDLEAEIREHTGLHSGSYKNYAAYLQSVMRQNQQRTDDILPMLTRDEWEAKNRGN